MHNSTNERLADNIRTEVLWFAALLYSIDWTRYLVCLCLLVFAVGSLLSVILDYIAVVRSMDWEVLDLKNSVVCGAAVQ